MDKLKSAVEIVESEETIDEAQNATQAPAQASVQPSQSESRREEERQEKPALHGFERGFEDIVSKTKHSIVNIATMQMVEDGGRGDLMDMFRGGPFDDFFKDFFGQMQKKRSRKMHCLGSGFIVKVDKDKFYVVTNNHVVEKASKIVVSLSDKTELPAEVHATDQRVDVAVLVVNLKNGSVNVSEPIRPIEWGNSDEIMEGNWVIAIGNPFGFGSTVTSGIVSAKGRDISITQDSPTSLLDDLIQHSAAINMGNSGGCLLDVYGKVIGINNAIISSSGGNIGIGFAIPSNIAKVTVEQLIEHKKTLRGWIGVSVQKVNAKQAESIGLIEKIMDTSRVFGAFVSNVVPGGPAESGGVKVGDVIIEVDGTKISEKNNINTAIANSKIGSKINVRVWRQKSDDAWGPIDLEIVVGDFDKASKSGLLDDKEGVSLSAQAEQTEKTIEPLGITISAVPERYKSEYPADVKVVVTKIDEERDVMFYGSVFAMGDGIISANNKRITSTSQFKKIIDDLCAKKESRGRPVPFVVVRNGVRVMVATTLDFDSAASSSKQEKPDGNKKNAG